MKRFLALSTTLVAIALFWRARAKIAMAVRHLTNNELKHEIQRWEDEGGNVTTTALRQSVLQGGAM